MTEQSSRFYVHRIGEHDILIPVPPFSEEECQENLATYGTKTGENNLPYLRGSGVYISKTTTVKTFYLPLTMRELTATV